MRNPPAKQPMAASAEPVDAYATAPRARDVARCPPGIMARCLARLIPKRFLPGGLCSVRGRLGSMMFQLVFNIVQDIGAVLRSEFAFYPAQSNTNHIPMMQLATKIIAELEP